MFRHSTRSASRSNPGLVALLCLFLSLAFGLRAAAAIIVYTGPPDGNWHDPLNWDLERVPQPGDDVYVDFESVLISQPVTIKSLTVGLGDPEQPNRVAVKAGAALTIDGGELYLLNGAKILLNPDGEPAPAGLFFATNTLVDGDGEIVMNGLFPQTRLFTVPGFTTTIGSQITVSGRGGFTGGTYVNNGNIVSAVPDQFIVMANGLTINNNVIQANGGGMSFDNTTIHGGGLIQNVGNQTFGISNSTVMGNTLTGGFTTFNPTNTFQGVTFISAGLTLNTQVNFTNITADNLTIQGNGQEIDIEGQDNSLSNSTVDQAALFVQDSIRVNNSDFLNLGIRADVFADLSNVTLNNVDVTIGDGATVDLTDVTATGGGMTAEVPGTATINLLGVNNFFTSFWSGVNADIGSELTGLSFGLLANTDVQIRDNATLKMQDTLVDALGGNQITGAGSATLQFERTSNTLFGDLTLTGLAIEIFQDTVVLGDGVTINNSNVQGDSQQTSILVTAGDTAVNNTTINNATVDVPPGSLLDLLNATFNFVSVLVRTDGSMIAENGTFQDTTVQGAGLGSVLELTILGTLANSTLTDLGVVLNQLTLDVQGTTTIQNSDVTVNGTANVTGTQGPATIQIEQSDLNGSDQSAILTADQNVTMNFAAGANTVNVKVDSAGDAQISNEDTILHAMEFRARELRLQEQAEMEASEFVTALLFISRGFVQVGDEALLKANASIQILGIFGRFIVGGNGIAPGGGAGGTVEAGGTFTFDIIDEANWSWTPESVLAMTGGVGAEIGDWENWGRLEIGGTDLGDDPDNHQGDPLGFDNNFDLSVLRIGPGAHVYLDDLIDNGNRDGEGGAAEALYVDTLEFADPDGQLNLNGIHLYFTNFTGDLAQIIDVPVDSQGGAADITGFQIVTGVLLDGGVDELLQSDDMYLNTRSGFGVAISDLHKMELILNAVTTVDSPTTLDLTVEARIDEPAGTARLFLRNRNTGRFDQIASYPIGMNDEFFTIEDIDATIYVDSNGNIDLLVKHNVFRPFMAFMFESFVDWVEIRVAD